MKKSIITCILLASSVASANVPTKFNDCASKHKIGGVTNSNGVYFDKGCETAYVLPPKIGKLTIDSINPYNEGLCESHFALVDSYHQQILGLRNEMKGISGGGSDETQGSKRSCRRIEKEREEVSKRKTMLQVSVNAKTSELNSAKESARTCKGSCIYEKDRASTVEYDLNGLQAALVKRTAELESLESRLQECQGGGSLVSNNAATAQRQDEITTRLTRLNQSLTTHYQSGIAGGDVVFIFETGHEELRSKYESTFSGKGLSFLKMPVQSVLSFNLKYYDEDQMAVPVLKSDIPHIDTEIDIKGMSLVSENYDSDYGVTHLDGAISGKVTLNVPTMCEIVRKQSTDNLSSFLTVNLFYKYGLQSTKDIYAQYETKYIYEYFKKVSKRGGLFRSRSSVEILENTKDIQGINIKINSRDVNDSWSENKDDFSLANEIRGWIVMKTAENVVDHSKTQLMRPDVVDAPATAAPAVSKAIGMCPHIYCQGAKLVFDAANGIFGGSTQSSSYINRINEVKTLQIESTKMLPHYGNTTFSIKAR